MKKTLDRIFWFIVMTLPLWSWLIVSFRNPSALPLLSYLQDFDFPFVSSVFDSVFAFFDNYTFGLTNFIAYLVAVEIAHCAFDIIVFIPRFCHSLIDGVFKKVGVD